MKRLLVLRHAKSSWAEPGQQDHDRPLDQRGRDAAREMGESMAEASLLPDLILSSDSRRTRETVALWSESAAWTNHPRFLAELYHASPETLLDAARSAPDAAESVMIVAHNPGIEQFVSRVGGDEIGMPTGGLAVIDLACESWARAEIEMMTLVALKRPDQSRD